MMKMKYGLTPICVAALLGGCASDDYDIANANGHAVSVPVITHGASVSDSGITNATPILTNRAPINQARAPALTNVAFTNAATNSASGTTPGSAVQDTIISQEELERLRRIERENIDLRQRNEHLVRTANNGGPAASATPSATIGEGGATAALPPNAKKGECYARVQIPAQYETLTEQVLDREGADRVEIIPAEYTNEVERILTREASEEIKVTPATYRVVTQSVEIEPARTELKTIPARYENVSEKILVRAAYTTWKKGTGPITKIDEATGEIMCLVEVPAEYKTVIRKELRTPAKTEEILIPARTRTVTKRVVDQPATTRVIPIPAKYDTIQVRKLVRPAEERRVPVEATYRTVSKQRKISDERLEWREILCETNTTRDVISRVQNALKREGYRPGGADGILGAQTIRALRAYQIDNGLPSGQLTIATVRRLGIEGR